MKFIRVHGRVVPLHTNGVYKGAATGVAAINGIQTAASLKFGWKGIAASTVASFGLDAVSSGLNAKAFSGKDRLKERENAMIAQESKNQMLGLGITAGVVGGYLIKNSTGIKKALNFLRRAK